MSMIHIQNLTRDYDAGKGIFDVSFEVEKGDFPSYIPSNSISWYSFLFFAYL